MTRVKSVFPCEAVVVQCGADGLTEDTMNSFNLSHLALAKCVCTLLTWRLPTILLGGGQSCDHIDDCVVVKCREQCCEVSRAVL